MLASGTRSPPRCGRSTRTRCRNCSRCPSSAGSSRISPGSRARWGGGGDPQARSPGADGGRAGPGGGGTKRGSRAAPRDHHNPAAPRRRPPQPPPPDKGRAPSRDAAAPGGGARSRPRGRLVLSGRSAEPRGRPARRPGRLRARRRARTPQRQGVVRPRHRAGPPQPAGRGDADVPPLAGGRRQVIRVVVDDLAFLASDALVRPATARLDPTTPVVRRLEQVGGTEFVSRLRMPKELAGGAAVVTAGGGGPRGRGVLLPGRHSGSR